MFRPGDVLIYIVLVVFISVPLFLREPQFTDSRIRINAGDKIFYAETGRDSVYVVSSGIDSVEIEIKNRMVRIKSSTCRDKYCIKKGWLKETDTGDIICMPNRVIISFEKKEDDGIDAVTE